MVRFLATGLLTMYIGTVSPAVAAPPDDTSVTNAITRLTARTILFGHQSVGANVLEGVDRLSTARGGALRVAELRSPANPLTPGTFVHVFIGTNGDASGKIRSFSDLMGSMPTPPDVAFMKLCWADFGPGTDVDGIFKIYSEHAADLTRRYPKTTFVHLTVPLTTVQSGPKAFVKWLLGRAPYGAVENEVREAYNARLREAYSGRQPFFDIARIEATAPDGSVVEHEEKGKRTLALVEAYTDDGGHLNAIGQDWVAKALLSYLASLR